MTTVRISTKGAARAVVAVVLAFTPGLLTAQDGPSGKVEGRVLDRSAGGGEAVIPGATVTLRSGPGPHAPGQTPPPEMTATTGGDGRFAFDRVAPGCYKVIALAPGLIGTGAETCLLGNGAAINLDIEMKPELVTTSVEVSAEADGVDTTESSATGAVAQSTLEHAPSLTERFDSYLPLLPGVVRGPSGQINLKGARGSQSGALVNGASATDPYTGTSALSLPIDVVAAVKVLSNPYDAEYGRFAGAVSTVDTKTSDFNKHHFIAQNFVPGLKRRDGHLTGIGKFIPRQTVSLPLLKNRIALTQSLEYRYIRSEVRQAGLPRLAADTGVESFDSYTRADVQINQRHTAAVTLSIYPQKLNYVDLNTFTPQSSTPDLRQRGYMLSGHDQYAFQSGALLESRLSFKTFDADVKANSTGVYRRSPDTTTGAFFALQERDTSRIEHSELLHLPPVLRAGAHLVKMGWNFTRETYDGRQNYSPVQILGGSGGLVQQIVFSRVAPLDFNQEQYTFFVQDKWTLTSKLTLDGGLRFDRNSTAREGHAAPRLGFAYVLPGDGKTVLRGGFGAFYDRVNLNTASFLSLPERAETRFLPSAGPVLIRNYRHRLANGFRDPLSSGWSLQVDREVLPNLLVRAGFQQRITTRNFVVDPESGIQGDFLTLSNRGRDRYREFEVTGRYRLGESSQLTASYVRSASTGNLNDLTGIFGNFAAAAIRPDERSRLAFDAPNRFLFWADISLPFKLTFSPVFDMHTGFPYSIVNEDRDFIGKRNAAGRFPRFSSTDIQVLRTIRLPVVHKKARIGIRVFNLFNHYNPVDVQNNIASARFGAFTNSRDRLFAGKLVFGR